MGSGFIMVTFNQAFRVDASDWLVQCLDGLEGFGALMDGFYAERPLTIDFGRLHTKVPSEQFGELLLFVKAIYTAKYRELTFAAIDAVNNQNFLVFALCGRAIIETTATLRYYDHKFQQQIRAAKDPDRFDEVEIKEILDLFIKHSTGGRFDWVKFWYAPRTEMVESVLDVSRQRGSAIQLNQAQVNVVTTVDKWAKKDPAVRLAYDFFCELVHPNLGSSFMIMGSRETEIQIGSDFNKELAKSLTVEGIKFLAPTIREACDYFKNLIAWTAIANPEP